MGPSDVHEPVFDFCEAGTGRLGQRLTHGLLFEVVGEGDFHFESQVDRRCSRNGHFHRERSGVAQKSDAFAFHLLNRGKSHQKRLVECRVGSKFWKEVLQLIQFLDGLIFADGNRSFREIFLAQHMVTWSSLVEHKPQRMRLERSSRRILEILSASMRPFFAFLSWACRVQVLVVEFSHSETTKSMETTAMNPRRTFVMYPDPINRREAAQIQLSADELFRLRSLRDLSLAKRANDRVSLQESEAVSAMNGVNPYATPECALGNGGLTVQAIARIGREVTGVIRGFFRCQTFWFCPVTGN